MREFLEVMQEGEQMTAGIAAQAKARLGERFEEKLSKFIGLIANTDGLPSYRRTFLMREAETTSDFPLMFGTVLERSLMAKYKAYGPDWRNYIKTGTARDFRPTDVFGIYGMQGQLKPVAQRGEYKQDAVLNEGKLPRVALSKYGAIFGLGWEAVINDDLGAFNDVSDRLAIRCMRTEYKQATQLLASATGPNTALFGAAIAHPVDGAAINNFNAAGTMPFNVDNLGKVCNQLRRQKDFDGEPILIEGFELVVPPALEIPMWQALNPAAIVASGGDSAAGTKMQTKTSANVVVQNLSIRGTVNPYLPIVDVSANADKTWYVIANLSSGYAAILKFLAGHESPELVMKNPNKVTLSGSMTAPTEGNFEEDTMWWRVRHILGGNTADPRMAIASIG